MYMYLFRQLLVLLPCLQACNLDELIEVRLTFNTALRQTCQHDLNFKNLFSN